jgi:hypothetical protein
MGENHFDDMDGVSGALLGEYSETVSTEKIVDLRYQDFALLNGFCSGISPVTYSSIH